MVSPNKMLLQRENEMIWVHENEYTKLELCEKKRIQNKILQHLFLFSRNICELHYKKEIRNANRCCAFALWLICYVFASIIFQMRFCSHNHSFAYFFSCLHLLRKKYVKETAVIAESTNPLVQWKRPTIALN